AVPPSRLGPGEDFGGPENQNPAITADALGELAYRELVAGGDIDQALPAALGGIGLGDFGQLPVGIEAGRARPQYHRERGNRAVVMHPAVEQGALLFCLLDAVADHDKGARQDFQVVTVAAKLVHAALDVGIKLLPVGETAAA